MNGSVYLDGSIILEDGTILNLPEATLVKVYLDYLETQIEEITSRLPNTKKPDASYLTPQEQAELLWLLAEQGNIKHAGLAKYKTQLGNQTSEGEDL